MPKKSTALRDFVCEGCGVTFSSSHYPSRKLRRFCSRECRNTANPIREFACKHCGKSFTRRVLPSRNEPQFCSKKCSGMSHHDSRLETFTCKHCGVDFQCRIYLNQKNQRRPQYCTYECSAKAHARPTAICKVCGKEFKSLVHHGKRSVICSVECRAKSQYKYPDDLRAELLRLFLEIGVFETSKTLKIPEWYIRAQAARVGLKPNPAFRYQRFKDNPSQLEVDLYQYLTELGVSFEKQYMVGHYVVDAFINPNIIIEADGDYWHGHPRFEPLTERQLKQQSWDRARNTYMKERGCIVIRIWECEMSKAVLLEQLRKQGAL